MPITLNSRTIEAVKTRLDTRLDHYIEQVNGEVTDGLYLDAVGTIYDYPPSVVELVTFPAFGIIDGPFELQDDTGWGATGWATFSVAVYDQHADQQTLAWRLRRYTEAIVRCVLEGRSCDPTYCYGVMLRRVDPGPTLGRENPQTFLSIRSATFQGRSEQDTLVG